MTSYDLVFIRVHWSISEIFVSMINGCFYVYKKREKKSSIHHQSDNLWANSDINSRVLYQVDTEIAQCHISTSVLLLHAELSLQGLPQLPLPHQLQLQLRALQLVLLLLGPGVLDGNPQQTLLGDTRVARAGWTIGSTAIFCCCCCCSREYKMFDTGFPRLLKHLNI